MELQEEPRLWTVGPHAAGPLLPVHVRLKLYANGVLIWPWRSAMFKHNKRRKPGPYKPVRRYAMPPRKRPGKRQLRMR